MYTALQHAVIDYGIGSPDFADKAQSYYDVSSISAVVKQRGFESIFVAHKILYETELLESRLLNRATPK